MWLFFLKVCTTLLGVNISNFWYPKFIIVPKVIKKKKNFPVFNHLLLCSAIIYSFYKNCFYCPPFLMDRLSWQATNFTFNLLRRECTRLIWGCFYSGVKSWVVLNNAGLIGYVLQLISIKTLEETVTSVWWRVPLYLAWPLIRHTLSTAAQRAEVKEEVPTPYLHPDAVIVGV